MLDWCTSSLGTEKTIDEKQRLERKSWKEAIA